MHKGPTKPGGGGPITKTCLTGIGQEQTTELVCMLCFVSHFKCAYYST